MFLFCLCFLNHVESRWQCTTIRGRAKCGVGHNDEDMPPIFIKLVDEDSGGPDDEMDETYTSKISGAFQLRGCASDPFGTAIDPELNIYHKCKGRGKMVTLVVPETAIDKEYNYTDVINLQGNFQNEIDYEYTVPKCAAKFKKPTYYYF